MRHATVVVALLLGSCLWADWLVAQRRDNKPTVRKVTEVEVADKKRRWSVIPLDVEFPDPAKFIQATASSDDESDPAKKKVKWSQFITPETIEKEVAVISEAAVEDVKNPGFFSSRGFRGAYVNQSVLAIMFNVAANYDGDMKWKDKGAGLRDLAVAAADSAENKDQAAFEASEASTQAVGKLVKTGNSDALPGVAAIESWQEQVSAFGPIMRRMEDAHRRRLYRWTANQNEFEANAADVKHEAEVLGTLAQVILDKSYDLAGEGDYREFAQALRDACVQTVAAVKENNYEKARAAVAEVNSQCDNCHTNYR